MSSGSNNYESDIRTNNDGTYTKVTRTKNQSTNYPHWTENYDKGGKRTKGIWDSHYSPSKRGDRSDSHKNSAETLKDLGIKIKK